MKRIYTAIAALSLTLVFLTGAFSQEGQAGLKSKRQRPAAAARRGNPAAVATYSQVGPDIHGIKQRGLNRRNTVRNGAQGTGNRRGARNNRPEGFYIDDIIIGSKNPGRRPKNRVQGKRTGRP